MLYLGFRKREEEFKFPERGKRIVDVTYGPVRNDDGDVAAMRQRGSSLNGLHRPGCVHLCVTLRTPLAGRQETLCGRPAGRRG